MTERLVHDIKPVYNENSKILFLGTFPSPKSREQGFFYGHPRNRMWKVLAEVLGSCVPETVPDRRNFLIEHGIAMWDVLASCEIDGASDTSIRNEIPNDLGPVFGNSKIEAVFLTGSKAFELYKKHNGQKYGIPYFRLPSTSPANAAAGMDRLVSEYSVIRKHLD